MERHFHEQLQNLKQTLLQMASSVEISIVRAIAALVKSNNAMADEVIKTDEEINALEIRIDAQCLKLLALQQPMAVDLRFITSAMKINNDLERIGDHAVNIAERAIILNTQGLLRPLTKIPVMAPIVQSMVKDSLDSFINGEIEQARAVCARDDKVDRLDRQIFRELMVLMLADAKIISGALNLILISKNLERIADLSTNIAEEVIFIYNAQIIKHHPGIKTPEDSRA